MIRPGMESRSPGEHSNHYSIETGYIYLYITGSIFIHKQTVSLYHDLLVWLDTRDASSCDRNPANFTSAW